MHSLRLEIEPIIMRKKGVLQMALQFNQNNLFSTTIQLHYNYTHDVMLMSLIVIHILKYDTWHYEDFWT